MTENSFTFRHCGGLVTHKAERVFFSLARSFIYLFIYVPRNIKEGVYICEKALGRSPERRHTHTSKKSEREKRGVKTALDKQKCVPRKVATSAVTPLVGGSFAEGRHTHPAKKTLPTFWQATNRARQLKIGPKQVTFYFVTHSRAGLRGGKPC